MIVNKITFADMAGISKPCVTLSIKRGKLEENAEGYIDTDAPLNAIYLATRRQKGKAPPVVGIRKPRPRKPAAQPPAAAPQPPRTKSHPVAVKSETIDAIDLDDPELPEAPDGEGVYDQLDKIAAEIRYKNIMTKRNELKFEQDKGRVIQSELIERMAAKLNNEIKSRLQDLPRRVVPRLMAMVRSGSDDREIQSALEREIDDGLEAVSAALGAPIV